MPETILKPKIAEVTHFLRKHNALIVHFSGAPKGAGVERGRIYPEDLQSAVAGRAMGGLSCSVVRPGDVFHGFERNATGCIGVVLGLRSSDSLVAVDPDDCGSMEDEKTGIREVMNECDISVCDLDRTMTERTAYNEWIVRDYVVRGIFAVAPFEISILKTPDLPPDVPEYLRDDTPVPDIDIVSPQEVATRFNGQQVYSFIGKQVCRWEGDRFVPIEHSEIYTDD